MNRLVSFLTIMLIALQVFAGEKQRPEIYVKIKVESRAEIDVLSDLCSIDRVDGQFVYAFALPGEVANLNTNNIRYQEIPLPYSTSRVSMATSISQMDNWNLYPTYSVYQQMLSSLSTNYSDICQLIHIGYSEDGRDIQVLKISDNVNTQEAEPEVYYTSTMHGDETLGWVALLRFAYELCESYNTDIELTDMVNNMEIFINPLANPDGTFYGGNETVNSARRYNTNDIDLNRNFIDPGSNTNGDSNPTAQENQCQMDFANAHNFTLSANFHGGAELVNYPWDTWSTRHVDDTWYQYISRNYATSVQNDSPSGYFTEQNNGITNGYDWYTTDGCRQDWMNYFQQCREVTIEISGTKLLNNTLLPDYYNYNRQAFIDFLKEAQYGIRGVVTDELGNPLEAEIFINLHDNANSAVHSQSDNGDFYRPIAEGIYNVTVSCSGYPDQTFNNVEVLNGSITNLNVTFGVTGITQNIDLDSGWNLVSFNTESTDMNPATVFASVSENLVQVKNLTQSYDPSMPDHFNTLNLLNTDNAYWVNMDEEAIIEIAGFATNVSSNINLQGGWNMVGYKPQIALSPTIALQSIISSIIQVKDLNHSYDPTMPEYFNTLDEMIPGNGYWMNLSNNTSLVYNDSTPVAFSDRESPLWELSVYPNNTATLYIELNNLTPEPNDWVGAFAGEECLGIASPIIYEANIYCTMLVQIPQNGTVIEFKYHDYSGDAISTFENSMPVSSGQLYNIVLNASQSNGGSVPPVQDSISIYPNPFNPYKGICRIDSKDDKVGWEIYNLRGQIVNVLSGTNEWDGYTKNGNIAPNGLYLVRPVEVRSSKTIKLIIMK